MLWDLVIRGNELEEEDGNMDSAFNVGALIWVHIGKNRNCRVFFRTILVRMVEVLRTQATLSSRKRTLNPKPRDVKREIWFLTSILRQKGLRVGGGGGGVFRLHNFHRGFSIHTSIYIYILQAGIPPNPRFILLIGC